MERKVLKVVNTVTNDEQPMYEDVYERVKKINPYLIEKPSKKAVKPLEDKPKRTKSTK